MADRQGSRAAALDALDHGRPTGRGDERHRRCSSSAAAATTGQPPARPAAWLVEAARETGTVTAELRLVPNQPVIFKDDPARTPRSEDDFIAYTWNKFLRTGDEKWPARLPMTKSAVRAMDAVTAFTATAGGRRQARDAVRRLRRLEARLDDVDDGGDGSPRHRHRAGGDRHAQRRAVVHPPLARLRRVVGCRQGLRRAGHHGLDGDARSSAR